MGEQRIRIEGPPAELERLGREIRDQLGDEVQVESMAEAIPGELRDFTVIGLAISAPEAAMAALSSILSRYMTHRERMEELRIYRGASDREIQLEELAGEESGP